MRINKTINEKNKGWYKYASAKCFLILLQNPSTTTKVLEQREWQKLQLYFKTTNNSRQTNIRLDKHNII